MPKLEPQCLSRAEASVIGEGPHSLRTHQIYTCSSSIDVISLQCQINYKTIPNPVAQQYTSYFTMALGDTAYLLGALTAGGGTMGYVRTGSVPSIAAGMTVGLLYGLGGYRIQNRQPYGVELALLASVVLGGSSIPRALRLRKPVPMVLSLISVFGMYTFGNAFRKTL
ncbi:transmembrane 14C domain protein [Xylariaceae sp. FL1272]|nr:transmembrane 14C domain protein [Xylariaceae sp. FL1272]